MTNRNRVRLSQLSLGLAIALAAAPAFAQNTTANIGGRIVAADSQPVSGAQVTILHVPSGTSSTAVTNADGRYGSRGLRVGGPYTITIVKDGVTEVREGVYLQLADTTSVDATLGQGAATLAAVEVTGTAVTSEIFSATAMGAGTSVSRDQLDGLASIQRNLQDYARLDPRLSQTDKERGEISAGGQNVRFNSITIDGVTTNDTFGLEANNLPTLKQPISIDAIESVQVNIANYDVTQKGYTGANINAVTKSGTNDFKGSVYYVYRDDSLAGDRYNSTDDSYFAPPAFDEDTKGFTFGGPLIKDRLFFFVSYEELESSRNALNFGPLGSDRTNVAITPSAIIGAQAISSNVYGFDAGEVDAAESLLAVEDSLIKIDANLSENHRASLRWSKTEQGEPLFPTNFNNAISLSSHWYNQNKTIETYVAEVFSDWTENFSTEAKISYRDYASAPANNSFLPQIRLNFARPLPAGSPAVANVNAGLVFGTERSRHFNDLATETWNYYAAANWFLGDHEVKFGFDYDDNDVFNAFLQDVNGNYTFACINASATFTYADPTLAGLNCNTATRAQNEAAVLENYRRGRPLNYSVQVGLPGFDINDGVAVWDYQNLGLFLQDTWAVNYNLTLMAGVRVDRKSMGKAPILNNAAAAAVVDGTITGNTTPWVGTTTRASGGFGLRNNQTLDGNSLFQPRVGFNYTFDADRPTQLRGGYGLFEGAAANVWLSNPYSNTGLTTAVIGCGISGFSACPPTDGLFNPDPNSQPTAFAGSIPAPNVDFLSPDLEQPSVWKMNLAFDHELPWGGMVVSAEYIRTEVESGIYYRHLNIGAPTAQGTDGRNLFYTPQGLRTTCWNDNGSSITGGACSGFRSRALNNPNFNNVLVAEKTGKGGGDNLSISLSGVFNEELNWSIGYSYTEATEVSPLTSSVSNSNWNSVSVFQTNEEVEANSTYLVKDRFLGQVNWSRAFFGDYKTRVGVFYEGRTGRPFSWTFDNDLNGDGNINDLLYIPTSFGSGEVVFRDLNGNGSGDEEARFWDFVNANGLNRYAGGVVDRNSSFAEWTNNFDVRISQELPGFFKGNKTVIALDILNFGNLLNKEWGRIEEIGFQSQGGLSRSFVEGLGLTEDGRYVYGVNDSIEDYTVRQNRGESQWAAQFTVRYEF